MSIRSGYNPNVVGFGIMLENYAVELHAHAEYLNYNGYADEWEDAVDRADQIEWWYSQWCSIHPGVVNCEHGMSLQNCYGPGHYDPRY